MSKLSVEEAKKLSIVSVAESLGMVLKRNSPREYYWTEHDSLKINIQKNTFKWYSKANVGGDPLDLVQAVKGVSFKDALHFLSEGEFPEVTITEQPREPFRYSLSAYEEAFEEGKSYLQNVRGLSEDTVQFFYSKGVLVQARKKVSDNEFESVLVFKNLDKEGEILGANLQGITPNTERYEGKGYLKQILYNSDGYSGLNVSIGSPKRLIAMESPIDLMSYYELHKDKLEDVRLVSMDGLKEGVLARYTLELLAERQGKLDYQVNRNKVIQAFEALKRTNFFEDERNQNFITLAVDNDSAGQGFVEHIKELGIPTQVDVPVVGKDWNEALLHSKRRDANKVFEDEKKTPASLQESRNAGGFHRNPDFLGDVSPRAASKPVVEEPQPDFPVITHLQFTTRGERMSSVKDGYHVITRAELTRLNLFAPNLQATAQWYLQDVSNSVVSYFYKDGEEVRTLQIQFKDENFAHLSGISPKGTQMAQVVHDFASGRGNYGNIQVSHSIKDKSMVLPLLPQILSTQSFILDDLSKVEKFHRIDLSQAIKTSDNDLLLAVRDVDGIGIPASVMRVKGKLRLELSNLEDKTILGIYRERGNTIEQIDLNDDIVKDNGQAFEAILRDKTYEEVTEKNDLEMEEIQMATDYTRILEAVYHQKEVASDSKELDGYQNLLSRFKDFDLVVVYSLENGLLDASSDFASEWLDEKLSKQFGVTSSDVYYGKITEDDFYRYQKTCLDGLLERMMTIDNQQVTDKNKQTERTFDLPEVSTKEPLKDAVDGLLMDSFQEEISDLKPLSVEKGQGQSVSEMIANNDTKALSVHMKEGIKQYLDSEQYKNFLTVMSKLNRYSPRNIQLILMQKPDATMIASFKSWKDNFNRHVNKGEKSLRVWAPVTVTKKDKETGELLRDEEGNPIKGTFFKLVPVFDVSQTTGQELPKPIYDLEGTHEDYTNLYRAVKEVAKDQNVSLEIDQTPGETKGYYSPLENKIVVKSGLSEQQTLKTLFHEMAHADLHNLAIPGVANLKRSTKELQAESVAYVVASHYGLDTGEYTFAYLANWSEDKATLSDLEAQLTIVQKEANSLINRLDAVLEKQVTQTQKQTKFNDKITHFKQLSESKKAEREADKSTKKHQEPDLHIGRQMR